VRGSPHPFQVGWCTFTLPGLLTLADAGDFFAMKNTVSCVTGIANPIAGRCFRGTVPMIEGAKPAMNVTIRKARHADEQQLRALYEILDSYHCRALPGLFREPDDPVAARDIATSLADPEALLLVAEVDGTVGGLAGARVVEVSGNDAVYLPRRFGYVDDMVVLPELQGRGVGRKLLEAIEEWAREQGADTLELTVFEFNAGARGLYERSGFETLQRRMRKRLV